MKDTNISIEIKAIVGIIVFTIFVFALERYLLSENIINQFLESKKSKNSLLLNTISPVVGLNISLGLDSANKEYLDQIVEQNSDLESMTIVDFNEKLIYNYIKNHVKKPSGYENSINYATKTIIDSLTNEKLGTIYLHSSNSEYEMMRDKNKITTIQIFIFIFVLLAFFIAMVKREFKYLKELSNNVLSYDPKLNNLKLKTLDRKDEVGIINNAIVSMVKKIDSHAKLLDEINNSLEQKVKERTKELEEANLRLLELSTTDPLTKISNRRHFETYFSNNWALAKRTHTEISIVMCDIDYFKKINDTFGHVIGDEVLIGIAHTMKESLKRSSDLIARYGGEEFIIILYDTNLDEAKKLCEDIQQNISKVDFIKNKDLISKPVTLSFGVSSIIPDIEDEPEDLIKLADSNLYEAKKRGRNCIVTRP